ncbi:catechol 1,2-dioxygenase [Sphingobium terrigena]|uniref:Catechol 1,2-dioxygenase n=1 Tax=Sphingobium terrigena TaxID=2304063 RepID=A0A418YUS6_9SPHN|nr:catechol 1,2-dioxygenase [Sphingobium terrigena]RJG55879.1 catechol 1,2-dioxygenase [Sphingobium terrigena]
MAEIVLGIGASHTTLMNTAWEVVDHLDRAHRFRDALREAARRLAVAEPEAVIIVGSNHFRGFWLDLMPAFTIGVDEVLSGGEHGTPAGSLPSAPALARHICDFLVARDFDIAFSTRLTVDHGISHAYQWLIEDLSVPIVPIVINCFAPPLPSLTRALSFGVKLRDAILSSDLERVAVIGTGGLSHTLPFPDWRLPKSDDDRFLVDSWREGRGRWRDFESRRRVIVTGAPATLNEEFDRSFLSALEDGRSAAFVEALDDEALVRVAGNGAAEIRAWLTMAAVMAHKPSQTLAYSPMPEWLTGMAVAIIANGASS